MAKQDMTKGQQPKDIFDVKRIREIIELMEEHDLSAVDLQQGDEKIKLNRGSVSPVYSAPPPVAAACRCRYLRPQQTAKAMQGQSRSMHPWLVRSMPERTRSRIHL